LGDAAPSAQQRRLISYSAKGDPNPSATRDSLPPIQRAMAFATAPPDAIHFNLAASPEPTVERPLPGAPLPKGIFLASDFRDKPYRNVTLHYSINPSDLHFTQTGDLHRDALEVIAVLYRDDGSVINTFTRKLPVTANSASLATPVEFTQPIAIPVDGNFYLRTAVHETATDRIGAIEIPTESIKAPPTPKH
jgi:hypothetical protein